MEKKERNQSMELCRLVAAVMVVFIHVNLHKPFDEITDCLARFAVPFFFMLSGYFSYARDSRWIRKRLTAILKLNIYAAIPYYLWQYYLVGWHVGLGRFLRYIVFPRGAFIQWLLESTHPAAGHLWFLAAMVPCYLGLWLYTRFREGKNYSQLYLVGLFLLSIQFVLSILLPANGIEIPFQTYRNGWLMGIPLFLMGMFLREYGEALTERFHLTTGKLVLLLAAGILLSILQWRSYGLTELYFGTIPELIGLMLLLAAHPVLPLGFLGRLTPRLGMVSTVIYVVHQLVLAVYEKYMQAWVLELLYPWGPWAKPLLVAAISIAVGFLWEGFFRCVKGLVILIFNKNL